MDIRRFAALRNTLGMTKEYHCSPLNRNLPRNSQFQHKGDCSMRKSGFKRIVSLLLALATVFVLCPAVTAADATAPAACPSCGVAWDSLAFEAWTETAITGDVHYKLTRNVTLSAPVEVATDGNLVLDLNGYSLYAAENSRVFNVSGGTLTVLDSSAAGTGKLQGSDVSTNSAEDADLRGGTVSVTNMGAFNLLSGTVTGGTATLGGNVFCDSATTLYVQGGVISEGTAVPVNGNTGRGGNIYTLGTATITGTARILGGTAQYDSKASYSPNNAGRGGNIFVQSSGGTLTVSGEAQILGGYAANRGGNILVNSSASMTVAENAEVYGGVAETCGNNVDVMTATLNVTGGTIYGSPAGGCTTNINVYSTKSVFNFTGGKVYGKIKALAGMTIRISGKPYIEHLYLPTGTYVVPGTFEAGAWIGVEAEKGQFFTGPLEDPGCYIYFFNYDKTGLTWYDRKGGTNAIYLTTGTPCQCCGEDKNDIKGHDNYTEITESTFVENPLTMVAGHYRLTEDVDLNCIASPIVVDPTDGYVTLDLNGYTLTGPNGQRVFTFTTGGTFNIVDTSANKAGKVCSSSAFAGDGGVIALDNPDGTSVLNVYAGTITGSVAGDNNMGGSIFATNKNTMNLYGGAISGGTSEDHGGNLYVGGAVVNIYDGEVTGGVSTGGTDANGTAFSGCGGNIYVTGPQSVLNIYGGTVSGGISHTANGGNIQANSGGSVYMYDGVVENGAAKRYGGNIYVTGSSGGKYSSFSMYGGTFGEVDTSVASVNGISRGAAENPVRIYNGTVTTSQNITNYLADCACYYTETTGSYIWNYGHNEDVCDYDCPMEQAWSKGYVKSLNTGLHNYEVSGSSGVCNCTLCGYSFNAEGLVAVVGGKVYKSLSDALQGAEEGSVITMLDDATETELAVSGVTLDLNGCTLTADAVTSVAGNIVDSTNGKGLLLSDSISLAADNAHLPVTTAEGLRFSGMTPDHTLERLDSDTVRVRFVFRERSYDTILDELIKAGNTELAVELKLTWTDASGDPREKTYVCDHSLLEKYAEKWNSRRFVATITGVESVTDLTCTVQVSSTAASGVTVAAATLNNVAYINQKLTWDQINSFPLKTKDMTVDEMRQAVLDFMYFNKTYLWTPDQTVNYIKNASGTADVMNQGQVYGGLPYVGVASGNVYRMMDYIDPETGLLDMEKAIPALATKDTVAMADLKYFGSQCSECVYWAWGRVMNSADYTWTADAVPGNDFIILGDIQLPEIERWSLAYNTTQACKDNGEQTMFAAYAQLRKADGLVYWTTAGHLVMAYSDPVVVYNEDGTINGDESYIHLIDQAQTWKTLTNDAGDTFLHKNGINEKYTFTKLFNSSYIPFTFKEFLGEATIQDTTVSLVDANGAAYVDGTIRESDRAYIASGTPESITWDTLFSSRVKSNYGIVDVYVTLYNASGEQFYRHAVRTATAGNKNLAMAEDGAMVTIWKLANVRQNSTYNGKIEVQLATGERVVIFEGNITT